MSGKETRLEDRWYEAMLNAIPLPLLLVNQTMEILYANYSAQSFFHGGLQWLLKHHLEDILPFGSPVMGLVPQVLERNGPVNEYRVDVGTPRTNGECIVDVYATPLESDEPNVVLMFQTRSITETIDRQLSHRTAAKSVTGLASMLAHEIKNPLSGIRGAAQLLDQSANKEDKALTKLITTEADRIVGLVDRMEVFSDERPIECEPVNIHTILDHVIRIAEHGFCRNVRLMKDYDPSLPPVFVNKDQLIQVFLNLVKNAQEACVDSPDPEITLRTGYRPGVRMAVAGSDKRISLPMEFSVIDNGAGVPADIKPHLFDPFITTKTNGKGLGLALVAKIIGDHGGVIECQSQSKHTEFRVLLPAYKAS